MPLAIDASSPALAGGNNDPWTTASFNPPIDSLIVAIGMGDRFSIDPTLTITDNPSLGSALSFDLRHNQSADDVGEISIWTAPCLIANAGSRTISVTTTEGSDDGGLAVVVFTGADLTTPAEGMAGGTSTSKPLNVSITTTTDGAWVLGGFIDWNTSGNPTSSDTVIGARTGDAISLAGIRKGSASSPAGSVSLNVTSPGTPKWIWAALAIRPAGGGGGGGPTGQVLLESGLGGILLEDGSQMRLES